MAGLLQPEDRYTFASILSATIRACFEDTNPFIPEHESNQFHATVLDLDGPKQTAIIDAVYELIDAVFDSGLRVGVAAVSTFESLPPA